jgi:hypothetical protein
LQLLVLLPFVCIFEFKRKLVTDFLHRLDDRFSEFSSREKMGVNGTAKESVVGLKFDHGAVFNAISLALGIIKEYLLVFLRVEGLLVDQLKLKILRLLLSQLLLITEILDQLVHLQYRNPTTTLAFQAIVRLHDNLEQVHRAMQQLMLPVPQLLVSLFL